jgi:hypothetical protein
MHRDQRLQKESDLHSDVASNFHRCALGKPMLHCELIPILGMVLFTAMLVVVAVEVGFRLGTRFRGRHDAHQSASVSEAVQTALALLAFVLALTFGVAAERFNDRRVLIIEEAAAIGTAYLRADLLPDKDRDEVQSLLREYLHLRVYVAKSPHSPEEEKAFIARGIVASNKIQQLLWNETVALKYYIIDPPRELRDDELVALNFLLSHDIQGKIELQKQASVARVSEACMTCGGIVFTVPSDMSSDQIPNGPCITADTKDADGMFLEVIAFASKGLLDSMEIWRGDLAPIMTFPDLSEAVVYW